jgi:hypothetical protein
VVTTELTERSPKRIAQPGIYVRRNDPRVWFGSFAPEPSRGAGRLCPEFSKTSLFSCRRAGTSEDSGRRGGRSSGRAIENLAIVVTTQNVFDHSERGLAMVAAPEEILLESTSAGMSVMDVSLERLRYLWARRDMLGSSEHCAVKQGLLGPQWRVPSFMARPIHGRCAKRRSDFLLAKLFLPVKVAVGSERAAFWGATCALPQVLSRPMLLAWQARTCR